MPAIRIAYNTLWAIDRAIQQDGGKAYRCWLQKVLPHIGDAYRQDEDEFRSHLGASELGQECGRALWYGLHWATPRVEDGRMLRLLNRGHLEEARFIAAMLTIGIQVYQQDENGKQYRIVFGNGHGGGSGDGVAIGIPDIGQTYALCEFKTHNRKSFTELAGDPKDWQKHLADPQRVPFKGKGVRESKFEHFVQSQTYMRKMGLPVGLYMAVCKDTDDLYGEVLVLDPMFADQFIGRGEKIIDMAVPPTKINNSPGFWKCKFCHHKPVCHLGAAPAVNCRTCAFSHKGEQGTWNCSRHGVVLDKQTQLSGCANYQKANCFQ